MISWTAFHLLQLLNMSGENMKHFLLKAMMFVLFNSLALPANADTDCSYCGEWKPTSKMPEQPHLPGERLKIDNSTIALPGCSTTKAIKVFSGEDGYKKTKIVFQIDGMAKCERPLPDVPDKTIVEIEIRPRCPGGEELDVTLFEPSVLDKLLASYPYELLPSLPGQMQTIKRKPRPKDIVNWRVMRANYDGCNEGSSRGAIICANAKLYEEDAKLNYEWRRLIGILPKKDRASVISQQRKWLKAHWNWCKDKNEQGWTDQWVYSFETICRAEAYSKRTAQFKQACECISKGGANCLPLPKR